MSKIRDSNKDTDILQWNSEACWRILWNTAFQSRKNDKFLDIYDLPKLNQEDMNN